MASPLSSVILRASSYPTSTTGYPSLNSSTFPRISVEFPPKTAHTLLRRRAAVEAPCNLWFSASGGINSPSTELSFSSSTSSYLVQKEAVIDSTAIHAVGREPLSYVDVDTEIKDLRSYIEGDLELTFQTASEVSPSRNIPDPKASSSAKTLSKKGKNPTQLNSTASQIQKLDFLQVFKYPLATEAAMKAMVESNTLVFVVDRRADKKIIRDAAKNVFKMRVKKVNTSMTPDGTKKAFLMLPRDCSAADIAKKIKIL